ncbi:4a-hydroxytetrahydrobiopterin dehydratase [Alicyclobacillus contaminans]|uniref:4a-hydroxytetrahydrobiopterin dehydratase n=1 Tax=Alicyclobacillus contaminans TaxID=392016 RepID=UPI0003FC54B9|nr:4a-hydroxytetrahydrobiopterin dehydratase [Alicyclobacillus contaminans]GMA51270.1 4a-hydroxytetrahydrobiopterin dehydratase [Alicyclobacillus contaminans]
MEKYTSEQVREALSTVPDWKLEEKMIVRRFRFPSFRQAMAFANGVAEMAEAMQHHPFIAIDYKVVTLRYTSWHAGGLTAADFTAANRCDALFNQLSAADETL